MKLGQMVIFRINNTGYPGNADSYQKSGTDRAAVITQRNPDGTVSLTILSPICGPYCMDNVKLGTNPGEWHYDD